MARLISLWRNLVHRSQIEQDLDLELRAAFDLLVDDKVSAGASPEDARRAARLELGSPESVKTQVRDARTGAGVEAVLQDVRFALRLFRRAPGFVTLAIVTLALGIGANAAVFGVLKSVLLDALPYAEAERLTRVYGRMLDGSQERGPLGASAIGELRERGRSLGSLAAFKFSTNDVVYEANGVPQIAALAWVEPGFFDTLGVRAALGRTFNRDEGSSGLVPLSGGQIGTDTARVTLLTYTGWQRLFGGNPSVIEQEIRVNRVPRTVIGVLPRGFVGPMGQADFYLPFDLAPVLADPVTARRSYWLGLIGRLRPGVNQETAAHEVSAIWTAHARKYPEDSARFGVAPLPLRDAMVGDTRTPLLALMASATLVLLIACANLAGALLTRSLARRKEFAVRVALGAGRRRLVRQLLTESVVLALLGGAAGLVLANALLATLRNMRLAALPVYADLTLDTVAVFTTAAIALCAGLAFGVFPALSVGGRNVQSTLRDQAGAAGEGRRVGRLRGVIVAGQLALCAMLLAGAGLLTRSLWTMATTPLGFEPDGVLTAAVRLPSRDYPTPETRARFRDDFAERLRRIPGVEAVATADSIPTIVPRRLSVTIEASGPNETPPLVLFANVSDEYFRTLLVPVRLGRTFDTQDRSGRPLAVVISESMARTYWRNRNPLGARIRIGGNPNAPPATVVGVVGDVRNDLGRFDAEPMVYGSTRQSPAPLIRVLVRTKSDASALIAPVTRDLRGMDAALPLEQATGLSAVLGEGLASRRLPMMLMAAFGALALMLASVGVYAMFASAGAARAREFAVRTALGSRPTAIAALMLKQALGWLGAGLAGGALGILVVVMLLRDLIHGVPPFDPIALGGALVVLTVCAAVALLIPVRRATRAEPMIVLKE